MVQEKWLMVENKAAIKETKRVQPRIEVYCGPMFSGKSDNLIRELSTLPYAGFGVIAFKPLNDDRRGGDTINSQNGASFPAISVSRSSEILSHVGDDIQVVGIDEAQFFDGEIVGVCLELVDRGKRVIVSGLDKDFRGMPFGPMATLKQIADHVLTHHAYCATCGEEAFFTQRVVNGTPAGFNDEIIIVGADELYEARCRKHHEVPGRPEDWWRG